jgi:hypothetical protein
MCSVCRMSVAAGFAPIPDWQPLLDNPPFPEYPSGHQCASGSALAVIQKTLGTDKVGNAYLESHTMSHIMAQCLAPPVTMFSCQSRMTRQRLGLPQHTSDGSQAVSRCAAMLCLATPWQHSPRAAQQIGL